MDMLRHDPAPAPVGAGAGTTRAPEARDERRLELALARLETAFRHAPIGMALVGLDGTWLDVNDAVEVITGRTREELAQLTFGDITHPDDLDADLAHVQQLLDGEIAAYEMEKRYLLPDGTPRWVLLSGSLVRDRDGEPQHFIAQIQDIDRRKQVEQELRETTARLEQQAADLARSNRELEQFASVAAHDLQEPLRMVHSFVQLLAQDLDEHLEETTREYVDYAVDGATRMQGLIQDLLAWSRVGTRGLPPQPCPLDAALDTVAGDLRLRLEEAGATLERGELPVVEADPRQVEQLLRNLVGNAVKFRHPERTPRVAVTATRDGDHWRIRVADNGIGIPEHQTERVFEIFQRLHSRSEYPGTGIGLAICRRIVERHDGEIHVLPRQDGTTIEFTLPAVDGRGSEEAQA